MAEVPRYAKRLIEVDLPIKRISAHARREKAIRHGHISTLHIWWARRPLAACRAVLCASLWPDPADPLCPAGFREKAASEMRLWASAHLDLLSAESFPRFNAIAKDPKRLDDAFELRVALLDFIADFANWDSATTKEYLDTSRALTLAAHASPAGSRPLILDPFAGGGAIPLEGLRVGADVFASDINPVAVLLNKVVLEYVPTFGKSLSAEVHRWGHWIKLEAQKSLAEFYPHFKGVTPAAYLWARTTRCEGPGCGVEIPLIRSRWIVHRGARRVAFRITCPPRAQRVAVEIVDPVGSDDVGAGTVRRGAAICPRCGYTTAADSVRGSFKDRAGGAADARLLAVISSSAESAGRTYRLPTAADLRAIELAEVALRKVTADPGAVPNETLPYLRSIFNIQLLGVSTWADLFGPRQLLAVSTFCTLVKRAREQMARELTPALTAAVTDCLALVVDRLADKLSSLARWDVSRENPQGTFGRQALGIVWDFSEVNPFSGGGGDWDTALDWVVRVLDQESAANHPPGTVTCESATAHSLPDDSVALLFTDPPYYDAVPYADLSDFFYVWLRRSIGDIHGSLFQEPLSPKRLEVVQLAERNQMYAYKTKENFERLMVLALSEGRRITMPSGLGVIVFAHKTTSAWEVMLQAVISSGWVIVASWPIDTEMGSRLRAMNSAVLASSVHLVCRPRESGDGAVRVDDIGDWREVLRELPRRIHEWMPRLADEGVVGADAIFACLGPALEVFSRYSRVEKTSGETVELKEYLEHVWAAVSKEAISMIFRDAETIGLEPDARLTAMWLWTLASPTGTDAGDGAEGADDTEDDDGPRKTISAGFTLEYDAVRKIAQGLGARLEDLTSVVEVSGDKARLLSVGERAAALFGKVDGALSGPTKKLAKKKPQMKLFEEEIETAAEEQGWDVSGAPGAGKTTLDRVHQAMLLFGTGRGEALRRFLVEDGVGRQLSFWKLAQALSALYPAGCDEKRWVDGVLTRKKALGF